jgi:hypothetical protein
MTRKAKPVPVAQWQEQRQAWCDGHGVDEDDLDLVGGQRWDPSAI